MVQLRSGANRLGRRPTPRGRPLDRGGFEEGPRVKWAKRKREMLARERR